MLELGCDNIVEHEDIMNHVLLVGHENLVSHISPDSLLDSTEKRMKLWKFCSRYDQSTALNLASSVTVNLVQAHEINLDQSVTECEKSKLLFIKNGGLSAG